jgi:hypothetical protein
LRLNARRLTGILGVGALALGVLTANPAAANAPSHSCSGTFSAPGVLTGILTGNVVVHGVCEVNAGDAVVHGDVTVAEDSVLNATAALNDQTHSGTSSLTVSGDVTVQHRGVLLLGCDPQSSPCSDDPHPNHPTLSSHDRISGDLIGVTALGMIVHNVTIHGSISQIGGGGGVTCAPTGAFAHFGSPAFSTYEDSTVDGDVHIGGYRSCWQGVARVRIHGDLMVTNNQMADPDAIEILSNHVSGDLVCHGNSNTWDNADTGEKLFPRAPEPNTVLGVRSGQCVLSSPNTAGDQPGPGAF